MPKGPIAISALLGAPEPSGRGRPRPEPAALGRDGVALLSRAPLFANLSKRHLRRLARLAEEAVFREGAVVVQAGQPGRAFYVIVSGRASVAQGAAGRGRKLGRLGPGDFFGELALLDGGPRTASVVADSTLTTIRLARVPFREMVKAEPQVALRLLESVAGRLRNQSRLVTE